MVERTQIDKVIDEQGFQRSQMTQNQMVRVGQILNVSKIVVGDINYVFEQYQVDVRVINVETGTIAATEGATFSTSSYRSSMQSVAQKLANKIAITPVSTGAAQNSYSSPKQRNSVEILWGYLKIFPMELGTFSSEPTNVINNINAQVQYGYNNWRIPTNEELSLMRANNYIGNGEYMTSEKTSGIVLLVTTGKDYVTIQKEQVQKEHAEEERRKAEAAEAEYRAKIEQDRINEQQKHMSELKAQGYVDLGLPSGTMWKNTNEYDFCTYSTAISKYGEQMPSKDQFQELLDKCRWTWTTNPLGWKVIGPNGMSIFLPSTGEIFYFDGRIINPERAYYWSSSRYEKDLEKVYVLRLEHDDGSRWIDEWGLTFNNGDPKKLSVRLIAK